MRVLFVILGQNGSALPAIDADKNPPMGRVTRRRISKALFGSPHHSTSSLTSAYLTASIAPILIVVEMIILPRLGHRIGHGCMPRPRSSAARRSIAQIPNLI